MLNKVDITWIHIMKKFVSVNAKFYKHSKASGEMAHVDRLFNENKNCFPEYTKFNFGSDYNLYKKYNEIHQRRIKAIKKNVRKDSNSFLDFVVSFSLEQWEWLEKKHGNLKLEQAMKIMMKKFMAEIHEQHHLFPVGYRLHADEGHMKQYEKYQEQQERIKNGELKVDEEILKNESLTRNIHAHVIFYNFDFKTKTSPLRKFTRKTWINFQDIAGQSFSKAGFFRGISKDLTKKTHLKKSDFVNKKLTDMDCELLAINADVEQKKEELRHLNIEIAESKTILELLEAEIKDLFSNFKLRISKYAKSLLKFDIKALDENIEQLQNIADETSKLQIESAQTIVEETNLLAKWYKKSGINIKLNL